VGVGNWITIAALAVAGIVWAVRLEGQVRAQDVQRHALVRELAAIQAHHQLTIDQVRDDLRYIRSRVDEAIDK
jgi:uncharacterized coiled-coil protein SlyX